MKRYNNSKYRGEKTSGYYMFMQKGGQPFVQSDTYATNAQQDMYMSDSEFKGSESAIPPQAEPNPKKRIDPWAAFLAMNNVQLGLSEIAGRIERSRQNNYYANQMSTLGQMNPMPTDDYQPNEYNLYSRYGGSLKHYRGGGIHIKKENRGKFTASAKRAGMGVQEYAHHVMSHSTDPTLRKRANFAINFGGNK
jgi:hypothetical protein